MRLVSIFVRGYYRQSAIGAIISSASPESVTTRHLEGIPVVSASSEFCIPKIKIDPNEDSRF